MSALLKFLASSLLILQLVGCATAPVVVQQVVPSGDTIAMIGFVKVPGRYSYYEGMTVVDALGEAGGYGKCASCQKFYDENGWHPTFDMLPKVQREGRILQLPKAKPDWMKFTLQRGDEIKFRHIMF